MDDRVFIFLTCVVCIVGAVGIVVIITTVIDDLKQIEKQEDIYRECIAHETDYAIYMDGIRQDPETFKIESLNTDHYTFKLDDDNKTILIIPK